MFKKELLHCVLCIECLLGSTMRCFHLQNISDIVIYVRLNTSYSVIWFGKDELVTVFLVESVFLMSFSVFWLFFFERSPVMSSFDIFSFFPLTLKSVNKLNRKVPWSWETTLLNQTKNEAIIYFYNSYIYKKKQTKTRGIFFLCIPGFIIFEVYNLLQNHHTVFIKEKCCWPPQT